MAVKQAAARADDALLKAWQTRWQQTAAAVQAEPFTLRTDWRLVTGLGRKGPLEVGFTFHRYGFPILPGSSLKGLARAWGLLRVAEALDVADLGRLDAALSQDDNEKFEKEWPALAQAPKSAAVARRTADGWRELFGTTANAGQAMEVMIQENERDASAWKTEWIIVPESFVMASAILQHLQNIFSGLVVRKVRMEKNTHLLKGLLLSEAVMFVLADAMPLPEAHERVYEASMKAFEKETNLLDELLKDPEVKRLCDRKKIAEAMNAANYTGLSAETVAIIKRKIEAKLGKG